MSGYQAPHLQHSLTYRLHLQRESLGFSPEYCEAHAEISVRRWQIFKRGVGKVPNSKELKKLALMGFDLNFIFGKVAPLAQAEKTLIENYRAADESGQKALRRVGTALAKQVSKAATGTDDD